MYTMVAMEWFRRLYARRIVNVNVNVVLAGILALGPTVVAVHLSRYFGLEHLSARLGVKEELLIMAISFVADLVSDVSIYFVLHWLANHSANRRLKEVDKAYVHLSVMRDASIVQLQRMVLSPLLYFVAFGLQYSLLSQGVAREAATGVGFIAGILTTRVLHTMWMLRDERKAACDAAARAAMAKAETERLERGGDATQQPMAAGEGRGG